MKTLPEPWLSTYNERRDAIRARLEDFRNVPKTEYFYELIFCILTPQSHQKNAEQVIQKLKADNFFDEGFDPTSYLRDGQHYIRFHNVKAKRLLTIREIYPAIEKELSGNTDSSSLRDTIVKLVPGFGLKEGAHFLRNIGHIDNAILDRHIFKHLLRLEVIDEIPKSLSPKIYYEIEKKWKTYAKEIGIPIDELDLLFWSIETGEIKK
jgi:N-glycosylase/DNA lyase